MCRRSSLVRIVSKWSLSFSNRERCYSGFFSLSRQIFINRVFKKYQKKEYQVRYPCRRIMNSNISVSRCTGIDDRFQMMPRWGFTFFFCFFIISTSGKKSLQSRVSIPLNPLLWSAKATRWSTCYWQWSIASKSSWAPSGLIRGVASPRTNIGKRCWRHYKTISRRYRRPTPCNMPSNPRNHQYLFVPDGENRAARFPLFSQPPRSSASTPWKHWNVLHCKINADIRATLCSVPFLPRVGHSSTAFSGKSHDYWKRILIFLSRGARTSSTTFMHHYVIFHEVILHFCILYDELKLL